MIIVRNPLDNIDTNLANKAYGDLAQPAFKQAGDAFGTVVGMLNVLVAPLERFQLESKAKTERFKQDLSKKYNLIPSEKIIEPPLNIVARSLEAIKYNLDEEEIREYFLNLIASSMNADKVNSVHPSFVNKIQELSTHDAIVFRELYNNNDTFPIIKLRMQKKLTNNIFRQFKSSKYLCPHTTMGIDINPYILNLPQLNGEERLNQNAVSIQVLSQLGFVNISFEQALEEEAYNSFETLYDWDKISSLIKGDNPEFFSKNELELALVPGILQITPIGIMFGQVCCE